MFSPVNAQVSASSELHWKGRDVFRHKGCDQCHSVYGKGGKGGPDLGKQKFYGTHLQLAALMWNHFPGMSKRMQKTGYQFTELNREEMSQLISYLAHIRYCGEPGNARKGQRLLKTKGCMSCHIFGNMGSDIGPDFSAAKDYMSPLTFVTALWNHGPNMMGLFQEYNIKRPAFKGNEIIDLVVGIRSYMLPNRVPVGSLSPGDPLKGKKLVDEKGCMRCHSFRGLGGELAPDFDDINLDYSVTQIAGKMWNHGPKMWELMESEDISFPTFEKGEMADLIAYLYGLKLEDAPGNAEIGSKIVGDKGCLSCHSVRGHGADIAQDLTTLDELDSPQAMIAAMWNHAPSMREEHLEKKLKWPELSGRDVAHLYAYLRSLTQSNMIQD
jgi:cytochrome c551/c552